MAAFASAVSAQPTGEQLQAMYDDAMRQLQQAQDRKNQLANENEQLKATIAELQAKVSAANAAADPTYTLRAQAATFEAFLSSDLSIAWRFQKFEEAEVPANGIRADLLGIDWPFRVASVQFILIQPLPATMPTTVPTTAPAAEAIDVPATMPATTEAATSQPTTQPAVEPATTQTITTQPTP